MGGVGRAGGGVGRLLGVPSAHAGLFPVSCKAFSGNLQAFSPFPLPLLARGGATKGLPIWDFPIPVCRPAGLSLTFRYKTDCFFVRNGKTTYIWGTESRKNAASGAYPRRGFSRNDGK